MIPLTSKTQKSKWSYKNPLYHWKQIPAVLGPLELKLTKYLCEGELLVLCSAGKRGLSMHLSGGFAATCWAGWMQEWPAPFQVSAGKYAEHKLFDYLPKCRGFLLSFLLYCSCIYAPRECRNSLQSSNPLLGLEGGSQLETQVFLRLLPSWKYSCNYRATPFLPMPPPSLQRTCPSRVGAVGSSPSWLCKDGIFPSNISGARASWEVWNVH